MIKPRHSTIACVLVLIFGFILFYVGTGGFRAYTSEAVRVNQLEETKPLFPHVTLEDSQGRKYSLSEFENKHVFITFIYTSCTTVCVQLENNMAEVYKLIPSPYIGEEVVFLSISFDPLRDDSSTLDKYKDYFFSDGETWRMARVPDQAELQTLLDAFGVIVIPNGHGHFTHNSAFYLVDRKGKLIDVMDYTKIGDAANTITSAIDNDKGESQ